MRALITKLIAWLERLAGEGKTDMNDIATSTENVAAQGLAAVGTLISDVKATAFDGVAPENGAAVDLRSALSASAIVASDLDAIMARVKDLLAVSGQTPKAWNQILDFAGSLVPVDDTDAMLGKMKELIQYSGQTLKGWDQLIALAKTLAA